MVLTKAIPLEGVKARFDHFAYGRGRMFVSALGGNSVEIIHVGSRTLERTIPNGPDPQGEAFSPDANKLFVASGRGKVYIFDGNSYKLITMIDLEGGADNLRYDAASKRVYVGCGDDEKTGAIAMIGAMTNKRLRVPAKRSRPLSVSSQGSLGLGRRHGRILWQARKRIRSFLPGSADERKPKRRDSDLYRAGLTPRRDYMKARKISAAEQAEPDHSIGRPT
ncbi:MAG: YncE family protein [Candidatus Acidiferrales bacterium]